MTRLEELDKVFAERRYFTAEEWYEVLILQEGTSQHAVFPDASYAETYRGKVPDLLIRLWLEHGWGSWNKGKYWLCDPALLQPLIDTIFEGDPDYDAKKMVVYAYDAFGAVHLWLGDHRVMRLQWLQNYAIEQHYDPWNRYADVPVSESENLIGNIQGNIPTSSNKIDGAAHLGPDGRDMLPRAIAKLGELQPGEIFGFFPALSLGGENHVKNLQRVPVLEHLIFLASAQTLILRKFIPPTDGEAGFGNLIDIRPIGQPPS